MSILVNDLSVASMLVSAGVVGELHSLAKVGKFGETYVLAPKAFEGSSPVAGESPSTVYTTEEKLGQILDMCSIDAQKWAEMLAQYEVSKFQGKDTGAWIVKFHKIGADARGALALLGAKIAKTPAPAKAKEAGESPFVEE